MRYIEGTTLPCHMRSPKLNSVSVILECSAPASYICHVEPMCICSDIASVSIDGIDSYLNSPRCKRMFRTLGVSSLIAQPEPTLRGEDGSEDRDGIDRGASHMRTPNSRECQYLTSVQVSSTLRHKLRYISLALIPPPSCQHRCLRAAHSSSAPPPVNSCPTTFTWVLQAYIWVVSSTL